MKEVRVLVHAVAEDGVAHRLPYPIVMVRPVPTRRDCCAATLALLGRRCLMLGLRCLNHGRYVAGWPNVLCGEADDGKGNRQRNEQDGGQRNADDPMLHEPVAQAEPLVLTLIRCQ